MKFLAGVVVGVVAVFVATEIKYEMEHDRRKRAHEVLSGFGGTLNTIDWDAFDEWLAGS